MDHMSTADNWIAGIPTALVILVTPVIGVTTAVRAAMSGTVPAVFNFVR